MSSYPDASEKNVSSSSSSSLAGEHPLPQPGVAEAEATTETLESTIKAVEATASANPKFSTKKKTARCDTAAKKRSVQQKAAETRKKKNAEELQLRRNIMDVKFLARMGELSEAQLAALETAKASMPSSENSLVPPSEEIQVTSPLLSSESPAMIGGLMVQV